MAIDPFRIFILGAGFSKPAGYPLAPELWTENRRRATDLEEWAETFQADLNRYIQYKEACTGKRIPTDQVDFEDFCRIMDIEHFLRLRGSDTWSQDGSESTVVVKTLLGQILAELTPPPDQVPDLYLEFARRLQPNDYVLTFNCDILLERALDAIDKRYRLFPTRYETAGAFGGFSRGSWDDVVVLKLHGSIDWFDRSRFYPIVGVPIDPEHLGEHPVSRQTVDELGARKLLDGPRTPEDPLDDMYRVDDVKTLYERQRRWMFVAAPWLLAPSTMKILYASKLADFWYGLGGLGTVNSGMTIIGYSLPPQDEYVHQAIYGMVRNYQSEYWDEEVITGRTKSPLVIVDYRTSEAGIGELERRYRFVDWSRATTHYEGFDHKSLDLIFRSA